MAIFLLIRHGHHPLLGKRHVGRTPGVHLSEEGRNQSETLASQLAHLPIRAIYTSPLERAQETAAPLERALQLQASVREELNEIDIGDWSNLTVQEIENQPGWKEWNELRSCVQPPGGELMLSAQARGLGLMEELRCLHAEEMVACVSHGDIVKGLVAHYLGVHLDLFQRIEIEPASVSVVRLEAWGPRVLAVNWTGDPATWAGAAS
jgi:probable phosphomutase (TIGR03848 family)